MGDTSEVQLQIMNNEGAKEANSHEPTSSNIRNKSRSWWIKVSIHIIFVLAGQSLAVLLGRLYFLKGGNSNWMATLVQLVGYPLLVPYYFFAKMRNSNVSRSSDYKSTPFRTLVAVYGSLGVLVAADCFLYSIGLKYLPVSTYTLLCASQLAFNSLFSYFFNSQKFTPFIINSLVILTISSVLLVFNNESSDPATKVSKLKYAIGFVTTIGASAGYGLVLSLTQFCFNRILKSQSFKAVIDMIIYQELVATFIILIGLFASGEWNTLTAEMNSFEMGKVSYVMNLVWTAVAWQVFAIGCVGLIFEVSSLFSNAISAAGLPIVPVLAVIILHDKMDGIKGISMVLAIWGFVSYVYQHYLDDREEKIRNRNATAEVSKETS